MHKNYDVFVSHSSKDKTVADAIVHYLEERKIKCWIAPRDIIPSVPWAESIVNGVKRCKMFLLVFCTNSLESKQVQREVNQAINADLHILPFRIENISAKGAFSYYLDNIHWLDAFSGDLEENIEILYSSVAKIVFSEQVINNKAPDTKVIKLEVINNSSVNEAKKRLLYIDKMEGYFSGDYKVMRDEYVALANQFINEESKEYCKSKAIECRVKYTSTLEEENKYKQSQTRKQITGIIMQLCITAIYAILLWGSTALHSLWEINNYFFILVPLLVYVLLIGIIDRVCFKLTDDNWIGMFLYLCAGIAQVITVSVWFASNDSGLVSFIGHFLFHLILSVIALILGFIISANGQYKESEIRQTVFKNPEEWNSSEFEKTVANYRKVYPGNADILAVLYNNISIAYEANGDFDIAFEYMTMSDELQHEEEK